MSPITTHILDTSRGRPADDVEVTLHIQEGDVWREIGRGRTNEDGRVTDLLPGDKPILAGQYRIDFAIDAYFQKHGVESFYPSASIVFLIRAPEEHYHVPLLLNPFGYSTYRGS